MDMLSTTGPSAPLEVQPVVVVYVRPSDRNLVDLDARLEHIATRYQSYIKLDIVEPENLPPRYAHLNVRGPCVVVLRGGEIVGEAMGAGLPVRELDTVVRCALNGLRSY